MHFKLGRKHWVQILLVVLYYNQVLGGQLLPSEDECVVYDSCRVNDFFRTCSCDVDCYRYDTCCFDAAAAAKRAQSTEDFECYSNMLPQPVFMKKTCSPTFTGDLDVVTACEEDTRDWSDLMANALVSSNQTWTTYKNWNCALCNNEQVKDLWFWTVSVSYPMRDTKNRLTVRSFRRNFTYDESVEKWGIYTENGRFIHCPLEFNQPLIFTGKLRYCAGDVISQCHSTWSGDDEVKRNCSSYYAERKLKTEKKYFKNVYCALCNGLEISDLECFGRHYWPATSTGDVNTMRIIYYLNTKTGEQNWPACRGEKRYDPFLKECRSLISGLKDLSLEVEIPDEVPDSKGVQMHPMLSIYNLIIILVCVYI